MISMTKPMIAPIPAASEQFGLDSFHTSQRIRPTIGIRAPRTPHPAPPVSFAGSAWTVNDLCHILGCRVEQVMEYIPCDEDQFL